MLRNEDPFQALRLRSLYVLGHFMSANDGARLAVELAAHPWLRKLELVSTPFLALGTLAALVDAALALRLTRLALDECPLRPESAVALSRLLHDGDALRELSLSGGRLLDAHAAALLADALRSNRTLTALALNGVDLWRHIDATSVLFGALVGHASLTSIFLQGNFDGVAAAAAGTLLGALMTADSRLRVLDISRLNDLGDAGLGPLVDALPRNTHLRELRCSFNAMSAEFARNRLMPALAANTSPQKLDSGNDEADAFIKTRTAAAAARA